MNNNLSFYRWFFQRLTAFFLLVFLFVHLIVACLSADQITLDGVIKRIQANNGWLVFYLLFLGSTLFHGLNGLYGVIYDYAPSDNLRKTLRIIFWVFGLIAFVWGIRVLIMFFRT